MEMRSKIHTKLKKLMDSPIVWVILAFIAVLSFGLSIYPLYPQTNKQFAYYDDTRVVISSNESILHELDIRYMGNKISELRLSTIRIWNSGRDDIRSDDIASLRPLTINFLNCGQVYKVSIIDKKSDVNRFSYNWVSGEPKVSVDFEFFNPNDFVVLQVLHQLPATINIDTLIIGEECENVIRINVDRNVEYLQYSALFCFVFIILFETYNILFKRISIVHAVIIIVVNVAISCLSFSIAMYIM